MNPTALPARRVVVIVVDGLQDGVEVVKNNFDPRLYLVDAIFLSYQENPANEFVLKRSAS